MAIVLSTDSAKSPTDGSVEGGQGSGGSEPGGPSSAGQGAGSDRVTVPKTSAFMMLAENVAQELPPASVLKYPGSEPLVTATFRLIETLSDEVRPELLGTAEAELRQLQRLIQRLYEPPPKYGLKVREQRLIDAGKVLRSIAEVLRKESRPCRMAYDELRQLCDQELKLARMAIRSQRLANSYHFEKASLRSRAEVIAAVLPEAPKVWLVHWRTLQSVGRLPDNGEKEFLIPAATAYMQHGDKAVMVPVIHHSRKDDDPDPHRVTCRQLVTWAQWYRLRWGEDLEIFYWIESCCMPDLARQTQDGEHISEEEVLEASAVGMLNPIARRGLRTLQAWIDEQPEGYLEAQETNLNAATPADSDPECPVTQGGADAMLPLVYAAADAVVVCESRDFMSNAWVRLHLALARAFSPTVRHIYLVDRKLIHVPKHIRHPIEPDKPPLVSTVNSFSRDGLVPYAAWQDQSGREPPEFADDLAVVDPSFGGSGMGFHHVAGSTGASFFADQPHVPQELAIAAKAYVEQYPLLDPTDWANVQMERPEQNRIRLARLTAMCLDFPTLVAAGGFRRPITKIGQTCMDVCRVEPKGVKRKPKPQQHDGVPAPPKVKQGSIQNESSSESSSEDELKEESHDEGKVDTPTSRLAAFKREAPNVLNKVQDMYHLSSAITKPEEKPEVSPVFAFAEFGDGKKAKTTTSCWRVGVSADRDAPALEHGPTAAAADMLIRRAADPKRGGQASLATATLKPLPPPKGKFDPPVLFHPAFKPRTVFIGAGGQTAEQLRPANKGKVSAGSTSHLPSGGMAILSKPLVPRSGVAPDVEIAKGIFFQVTLEISDSAWGDGLGIGFTSQDPDQWPAHKVKPRYASSLPKTCLCGYSGRWLVDGHSEIIRNVRGSSVAWMPKTLRVGDVVTAVLAAPPADVFRILVNGRVVAERSASQGDLPDPTSGKVWGVVDVDGCCVKVRLGAGIPENGPVDLGDLASNKSVGGLPRPP